MINRVAIVGAGTMGGGLAHLFLQGNVSVNLIDPLESALEKAKLKMEGQFRERSEQGNFDDTLDKLITSPSIDAISGCDLVIEAVPEK